MIVRAPLALSFTAMLQLPTPQAVPVLSIGADLPPQVSVAAALGHSDRCLALPAGPLLAPTPEDLWKFADARKRYAPAGAAETRVWCCRRQGAANSHLATEAPNTFGDHILSLYEESLVYAGSTWRRSLQRRDMITHHRFALHWIGYSAVIPIYVSLNPSTHKRQHPGPAQTPRPRRARHCSKHDSTCVWCTLAPLKFGKL